MPRKLAPRDFLTKRLMWLIDHAKTDTIKWRAADTLTRLLTTADAVPAAKPSASPPAPQNDAAKKLFEDSLNIGRRNANKLSKGGQSGS